MDDLVQIPLMTLAFSSLAVIGSGIMIVAFIVLAEFTLQERY